MKKINNSAIGDSWEDVKKELFTPEEIVEIETSAALMSELIEAVFERYLFYDVLRSEHLFHQQWLLHLREY